MLLEGYADDIAQKGHDAELHEAAHEDGVLVFELTDEGINVDRGGHAKDE